MQAPDDPGSSLPESVYDCATVRARIRAFLAGEETVADRPRLRTHLRACAECRERYRGGVETLAGFAARGWKPRARSSSRSSPGQGSSGRRRTGVVKMLLPAFALCALWAIAGNRSQGSRIEVTALGGPVRIGGQALATGAPPHELARGRTCSTGAEGRASIASGSGRLVLGPSTDVMVERASPLRVRLFAGLLLYEGAVVVVSTRGIVETRTGSGVVRADLGELFVASSAGEARLIDPGGDRRVVPGTPARSAPEVSAR